MMAVFKWGGLILVLALLVAWGLYIKAGWGLAKLDDAARAKAPGSFLSLPEGQIHYRWDGPSDGPVIVMVHGYSTPNFIFSQNVAALNAAGFRTLRYDHFGRGWSDRPRRRYDIDFYDRTLLGLLDGLGVDQPVGLVGLSMGGPITAEFTARHPERVRKLFLFVPAGFAIAGADSSAVKLMRKPVIGDWLWRLNWKRVLLSDPQYDESALAPENRLAGDVTAQLAYKGYSEALLSTLRHMPMTGRKATFKALAGTGVPVMAVFGDADPTVLVASAGQLSDAVPQADVRIVAGGTHGLNYQRHGEVNPWLVDWFAPAPDEPAAP